jgi:hypothetical protein
VKEFIVYQWNGVTQIGPPSQIMILDIKKNIYIMSIQIIDGYQLNNSNAAIDNRFVVGPGYTYTQKTLITYILDLEFGT